LSQRDHLAELAAGDRIVWTEGAVRIA